MQVEELFHFSDIIMGDSKKGTVRNYCNTWMFYIGINPNTKKSYKILQKLSPKHAAHGVAQSPYPNYGHGKACLSKQPSWCAAPDPRLAHGRSWVRARGPAGVLRGLFFLHPPFLPPSGDSFICTFPTKPTKVLGLLILYTTGWVYFNARQ